MAALSDRQIMVLLASGDIKALGDLYLRYGKMVKSAIVRIAPEISTAELEEVSQNVFLTINDKALSYKEADKLKSWIYGIAVKKARTWQRNTWLRIKLLKQKEGEPVGIAVPVIKCPERQLELRQTISHVLKKLPKKQTEVLLMHLVEGFSGEEIAEILNIKHETVRTRLYRARHTLQQSVTRDVWSKVFGG